MTNLDVYMQILMYIHESWCTYANLDVYFWILMYIYESWRMYMNLDVYFWILMYISLSCHINNDHVVLSLFNKHRWLWTPFAEYFLNFEKSCILSCWLKFDNKKWWSPSSFLSYKRSKLKLRVFLAGHIVSMVTYWATKLTATYSPMIVKFGVNKYRVVIMTHQTLSLEKYWKLFPAT